MAHSKPEPFIIYFSKRISPVRVVNKKRSPVMHIISFFLTILTKLGVVKFSKKEFMEDYVTTIGRTIYGPDWSVDMEPNTTVLHELVHVLQFKRFWMEFQYLFSKKWRSYYESSADQVWMITHPEKLNNNVIEKKAIQFTKYGIPYAMILEDLKKRRVEATLSNYQPEAKKVAFCFIEWRNLCLNNSNTDKQEK